MKLPRRRFLHLAAGAAALPTLSRFAWAQAYPTRPGRLIVRFRSRRRERHPRPPDGPMAVGPARPAIRHREPAGRRQQYRHRGGRARCRTAIRSFWSAFSTPSTRRSTTSSITISSATSRRSRACPRADVMVVHPSVPVKTVPEFIAYAKANPGKITWRRLGSGSFPFAGELFKMMAGVDMVHVPYRGGGPALTDLIGGQVQVFVRTTVSSIGYIKAGRLRALAVTTATRSDVLPDIPTVGEFVPGFEASAWVGIGAPKTTPAEIVEKLNKEINARSRRPKIKARLADLAASQCAVSRRLRQANRRRHREVGQVIRAANIKPE